MKSRNLMEEIYNIEEKGDIPKSKMTRPTSSKVRESVSNVKRSVARLQRGRFCNILIRF
jgi:16S rRNA G966 N2-methylase RsmD